MIDNHVSLYRLKGVFPVLTIGKTIKIIREAKGLKLAEVATAAGISIPFLSLLESEQRDSSLRVLKRLSKALNIPAETLILLSQDEDNSLTSTDNRTLRLSKSLLKLEEAERQLHEVLKEG